MRPTLLFYSVYRQTILLAKGRMLPVNGLTWRKTNIFLYEYLYF
jgi:hypothetical protein